MEIPAHILPAVEEILLLMEQPLQEALDNYIFPLILLREAQATEGLTTTYLSEQEHLDKDMTEDLAQVLHLIYTKVEAVEVRAKPVIQMELERVAMVLILGLLGQRLLLLG